MQSPVNPDSEEEKESHNQSFMSNYDEILNAFIDNGFDDNMTTDGNNGRETNNGIPTPPPQHVINMLLD
jgi:hypothetical protein